MNALSRNDQRAILAEFLATLFFVFVGTGAVVAALAVGSEGASVLTVVAIAHGIAILIAVAWTANLSGGHINPAVTLAMLITSNIRLPVAVGYWVAQFLGAAAGSLLLMWSIPDALEGELGAHALGDNVASGEGLLLEILLTAFLVLVVFNVAVSRKGWGINAPIAVGLAVMAIHFVAVPFTGASVNPARSFGPALVANQWVDFWIYLDGPAIGAVAVALLWIWWRNFGEDPLESPRAPPTRAPGAAGREP